MEESSITNWFGQLKAGEAEAAEKLWDEYFQRMVQLARRRLGDFAAWGGDEEDVALSAFKSFCLGAQAGRFPQLADRYDLWSLLVAITAHKASDMRRREKRLKRGGGMIHQPTGGSADKVLAQVIGSAPTPEFTAQVAEQFERLLKKLPDSRLRDLAIWKMEGFTVSEIAAKLNCAERTVKRKLKHIRTLWTD